MKVTRDGKAVVRVSPSTAGPQILYELNNQTIEMYVLSRNYERVNFTVIEYNNNTAEFTANLTFENPKNISTGIVRPLEIFNNKNRHLTFWK